MKAWNGVSTLVQMYTAKMIVGLLIQSTCKINM